VKRQRKLHSLSAYWWIRFSHEIKAFTYKQHIQNKMRVLNLIWTIATITTPAIAAPIETQDHTPLYSLVVTAPCVSDCIEEGMEKLVFTQANFTTGNMTNTTMQNFKTASTVSRPVATVDFEEVSALPHEVWVDHGGSKLHAAVS
jgi:hypothetical protein